MNKVIKSVLVICRDREILETILRLINNEHQFTAKGAITDQEAVDIFHKENFQLVLIGGGVNEGSEKKLSAEFKKLDPAIRIIQHFGGGSGLLFNEIQEAMNKKS
jgi:DNA-binding NtrC family response regulator